jgi:hypothetical protein
MKFIKNQRGLRNANIGDAYEYSPWPHVWQGMTEPERINKGIYVECYGHGEFVVFKLGEDIEKKEMAMSVKTFDDIYMKNEAILQYSIGDDTYIARFKKKQYHIKNFKALVGMGHVRHMEFFGVFVAPLSDILSLSDVKEL